MALHFTREEFAERKKKTVDSMVKAGLHGLLMTKQESMYYLTGHDTFGFCFYQVLYLGADGKMTLIARMPDVKAAGETSIIEDKRAWADEPNADPSRTHVRPMLEEHKCAGKRIGVEWESHGLTGRNARRLMAALDGFCTLDDASELVSKLRLIKSPAEIKYVRRAHALADDALDEAIKIVRPGAFEGDILAAMQGAIFKGDGDYPGNSFIIASGTACMIGRYHTGRKTLTDDDVLSAEYAGVYRQYHAPMWRSFKVGKDSQVYRDMWKVSVDAMFASQDAIKPGARCGDVFAAYAKVLDKAGFASTRYHSVGYNVGTTYAPSWMDWPMLHRDNPVVIQPGMTFFLHPSVRNDKLKIAALTGETVLVTEKGAERMSRQNYDCLHMT